MITKESAQALLAEIEESERAHAKRHPIGGEALVITLNILEHPFVLQNKLQDEIPEGILKQGMIATKRYLRAFETD